MRIAAEISRGPAMNIRAGWRVLQERGAGLTAWLPRLVARVPAPIYTKLLAAFLVIVALLITVGTVGLQVLQEANRRDEELVALQKKVASYRQLQNDTTTQLYSVASALLSPDEQTLDTALRQLNLFSYDLERLQFVAQDEADLLKRIEADHKQFTAIMTQVIELTRASHGVEARKLQLTQAAPLADNLERLTNQLVNRAEADIVARIDQNRSAYVASRWIVIGFAVGSIALALILGFAISWSIIAPVKQMDVRLKEIASGDFFGRVEAPNRDELGTLAANLNRMNDELGRLYTELRTRNHELTEALAENVRLFQELEEKSRQLEQASQHKSEFLANMSHELRTPLNAIIGFSDVLLERMFGELNPKQADYLQDILESGRHLLDLINDILDIAKVEAGHMELMVEQFALAAALENGLTMVRERASRHGIALDLDVDPAIGAVEADERKIKEVILNLLSNAVKFTPDGGQVAVTARLVDAEAQVAVRDTGVGIAPEDLGHVFEEFQQVGSATANQQEGTGLGLTLAKKFVELHGGRIWVESQVGVGSTFVFTLPLRQGAAAPEAALAAAAAAGAIDSDNADPTILLVEDDEHAIDLLSLYLKEADFNVVVARDGEAGLALARSLRPAAITLDMLLPRVDGWDFLARAKADPAIADIPVVIVSILDERGKGIAMGAAEFLVKPVNRDDLFATLRQLTTTKNGGAGSAKVLIIDDDPLAVELVEAILQPEGYTVLRATAGEAGVALARQELPSLIILDILLPEVDGFAVVERLRADPATARIPIVILTAKTMSHEEKERLNGQISYLARKGEFDRAAFVELVRAFCEPMTA
jgi:signal transduction histidine kinase/DNA-binding response OmpR family regulator